MKLPKCPACESSDKVRVQTDHFVSFVICQACGMHGPVRETDVEANAAWTALPRRDKTQLKLSGGSVALASQMITVAEQAVLHAELPQRYHWGRDAMETFNTAKQCVAESVKYALQKFINENVK